MRAKLHITKDEITAALQRFIKNGGVIHHLPDQEYRMAQTIGDEKYDAYESMSDLSKIANTGDSLN